MSQELRTAELLENPLVIFGYRFFS